MTIGGSFVPDVQRVQLDVSTADANQNDNVFCDDHEARDTRNENETLDVLPLDYVFDKATPNDTKVSELADEQRKDETLSGAFDFAKLNKGGYFCLLYTSPSPRDRQKSRMPSSA